MVFGMKDKQPHDVVGTSFAQGEIGALEDAIYERLQIRVHIDEVFEPSVDAEEKKRVLILTFRHARWERCLNLKGCR